MVSNTEASNFEGLYAQYYFVYEHFQYSLYSVDHAPIPAYVYSVFALLRLTNASCISASLITFMILWVHRRLYVCHER